MNKPDLKPLADVLAKVKTQFANNSPVFQKTRTYKEIKAEIQKVEKDYRHVLTGTRATVFINAPRALLQIDAESKLSALNWVIGADYKSKLKGVN